MLLSGRSATTQPKDSLSLSRVGQHVAIGNGYGTQCDHTAQRN